MDNTFTERLWRSLRSLNHEDVYLKGHADGHEARREWIADYNELRRRRALADRTRKAVRRDAAAGPKAVEMIDTAHMPQPQKEKRPPLRDRKERRGARLPTSGPLRAVEFQSSGKACVGAFR